MANEKLLNLIPESIREDLIAEVAEELEARKKGQQSNKVVDPVFQQKISNGEDPDIAGYYQKWKKRNQF